MAEEYRIKGYEAQKKGDLDEALSLYIKANEIGLDKASVYNDMGVIYEQLGIDEKAESSYLRAIKTDDKYLPAYSNLAYYYQRKGNLARSASFFKKRIEWGDPDDSWSRRAKSELWSMADQLPHVKRWLQNQEVVDLNRDLVKKAQREFYVKIKRAQQYYEQGKSLEQEERYQEAIMAYNQALFLTPDNPKVKKARERVTLRITKEDVQKHTDMAMRLLAVGDTASAKMEFRKILSIIPNEPIHISE